MDNLKTLDRETNDPDVSRRQQVRAVDVEFEAEAYEELTWKKSPGDGKRTPRRRGKRP